MKSVKQKYTFSDAIECNSLPSDTESRIKYDLICNNKYDKSHKDKNTTQIYSNFIIRSFDFVSKGTVTLMKRKK